MSGSALFDSLRQLKQHAETTRQQIGPWKAAIDALFRDIESWLAPATEEGLLSIRALGGNCEDEGVNYDVPILHLALPDGRTVEIRPMGLALGQGPNGLMGRIDIESGAQRGRLLWTRDGWQIARPSGSGARTWDLSAVTQEAFLALLNEFIPESDERGRL